MSNDSPEKIARYTIRRLLGKGGMGEVYVAWDPELEREVAVKIMRPIEGRPVLARSIREARSAAAIRHPNVATIHEIGTTESGDPFIAMEYCEGSTLISLQETKLPKRMIRVGPRDRQGIPQSS